MTKLRLISLLIFSLSISSMFGEYKSKNQTLKTESDSNKIDYASNRYRLQSEYNGPSAFVEYLLWQIQEQASTFVITPTKHSTIDLNYPNTEALGRNRSASFNWASGFRVGLGYTLKRDLWQIRGHYTWFATEGKKTFFAPSNTATEFLQANFFIASTSASSGTQITAASNAVKFSYQMGDLVLARTFFPTSQIQCNFSFGFTGGYIKENFHITYEAIPKTYYQNNWSFGGGSIRTSIDSTWHMGSGFGLCSRFSFAPILGQYTNSIRGTADSPVGTGFNTPPEFSKGHYQGIMLLPATQLALGFNWCRSFVDSRISAVTLALMGEFNNLPNLQQVFCIGIQQGIPSSPTGNQSPVFRNISSVYLYGGNFRFSVDY